MRRAAIRVPAESAPPSDGRITLSMRFPVDLMPKLEALALARNLSIPQVFELAMRAYIAEYAP